MTPTLLTLILHAAAIIGLAVGNIRLTVRIHRVQREINELWAEGWNSDMLAGVPDLETDEERIEREKDET